MMTHTSGLSPFHCMKLAVSVSSTGIKEHSQKANISLLTSNSKMIIKSCSSLSLKNQHSLRHIKLKIGRRMSASSTIKRIICRTLQFQARCKLRSFHGLTLKTQTTKSPASFSVNHLAPHKFKSILALREQIQNRTIWSLIQCLSCLLTCNNETKKASSSTFTLSPMGFPKYSCSRTSHRLKSRGKKNLSRARSSKREMRSLSRPCALRSCLLVYP